MRRQQEPRRRRPGRDPQDPLRLARGVLPRLPGRPGRLSPSPSPGVPRIYAVATLDSKGRELAYFAAEARAAGAEVLLVDASLKGPPQVPPDVGSDRVAAAHPGGSAAVFGAGSKAAAIAAMGEALAAFLRAEHRAGRLQAVAGLGGSEGTALIAPAFRGLPLGVPKLIVSTLASGNTRPYAGTSDMTLVFPVTDLAGLNFISRQVLRNAAHGIAAMARVGAPAAAGRPAAGLTMFGVTTACVDRVRAALEERGWEGVVFHAVGTGGAALEELAARGLFRAVLDLTTTEVADLLFGGIYPAAPGRFAAVAEHGVPAVISVGALDMVNFGPPETVPLQYARRRLWSHTPQVTLMRTTAAECAACARHLAARLNRGSGPWTLLLPEGGVSALDAPGEPFHDPGADEALFRELEANLAVSAHRVIRRVPYHINDPAFAEAALSALDDVLERAPGPARARGRAP